jgi:hypothetical protein
MVISLGGAGVEQRVGIVPPKPANPCRTGADLG